MRSIAEQLAIYSHYHQSSVNKALHFVGVPLIIFGLLVLFGWVHVRVPGFFDMPLSWLLTIIVLVYYFLLDILLAATLTAAFVILNLLASLSGNAPSGLSLQLFLYPFIVGWIILFVGHFLEKNKFSFTKNLCQMLIAPLFLIAEIFFHFGYKQNLKLRITELQELNR